MKALVLEAEWSPKKGYALSAFEKKSGKAVTGNSVWKSPNLAIKDLKMPKPGPDQVLIRIKACGVCGSDMHFYETDDQGYIMYPGLTKFPCALGHEFSGQIVEVGKKVKDFKKGDMVTAEEMIWCGHCTPCRNGYPNQCENLEEIGFTILSMTLSLAAVLMPLSIMGLSETRSNAPAGIWLWKPVMNRVAVSMSMAMTRMRRR